jgi:hypothetical protein
MRLWYRGLTLLIPVLLIVICILGDCEYPDLEAQTLVLALTVHLLQRSEELFTCFSFVYVSRATLKLHGIVPELERAVFGL